LAVQFTITNQQHEWLFDTNGNRYGQWTITFQTPSGVISQVIVPDDSYEPQTVGGLIAHEAGVIEEVQHLTEAEPTPHRPAHLTTTHRHHAAHSA
jgi:hypothetical protein